MSTSLTVLQSRVIAITSIISRGIIIHTILLDKYRKYKTTLESFEIYSPMSTVTLNQCKLFSIIKITLCLSFMIPFNVIKLYNLFSHHPDGLLVTTYFFFFYVQNLNMFLTENYYTDQCFVIYTKFREINENLKRLKTEQLDSDRFPFIREVIAVDSPRTDVSPSRIIYDKDFYRPKDVEHPFANTVELLKIRHWLTREAVTDLNQLFGIHVGISILALGVQALFDVYTEMFHYFTTRLDKTMFRSKQLFIGWVIQYSIRFCMIAITSNIASKQAVGTKTLITDIHNRYLDSSTKEELQLFYTQLSSHPTEFTACDLFTLNTRLITSAIAAGATYLLILVQFHSTNK